ncbi:hypothetical protein ABNT06_06070 [Kosakonia sacchari]|uniref:hypothetical protein n=1 Tax=Kosakonia sacchari TaxID=1158459 RepID=UPI0032D964F7
MHRIDTPTAQVDKFGPGKNGFTRGNPQTGTPATELDDDYFDMLQEELATVVEATGVALDKVKHDQLLTALKKLLLSRSNPFADIKADGSAAVATALANLGLAAAAKLPSPTFTTGTGYTLFKSPYYDGATVRWFATLSMNVTPPALTNNQTFSVTFPVAFSSDVKAVLSSAIGELTTTAVAQDLGCGIQSLSTTGMVILSAWGARAVSDGDFQFIVTGIMNA